jgi:hypothetical protein
VKSLTQSIKKRSEVRAVRPKSSLEEVERRSLGGSKQIYQQVAEKQRAKCSRG